ncbi:MAG: SAM-dependent methyltransferase [Anaerolineales bacterium]|jgi:cyclopropane-fatty-acyl-phospholipid synthase
MKNPLWYMQLVETGLVPDRLIRLVLQTSFNLQVYRRNSQSLEKRSAEKRALIEKYKNSPIAIRTSDPNRQHYEVPSEFFKLVLGKWLKYSCCYWSVDISTLNEAEEAMLELTCNRARLEDGMQVLDLGCGWGSLSLWIATRYPNCKVLAVSYSNTQREYIQLQSRKLGLHNVSVMTADMADFEGDRRFDQFAKFDRVISIEMFEHMKNYQRLLKRISELMDPDGKLFVHIFSHREFTREFDAENPKDWMAQTFFSGGTMLSDDLLFHFQRDLKIIEHWRVEGWHYQKTLLEWLAKLDSNINKVRPILAQTYGIENETRWLVNWRLFFLSCSVVWGLRSGQEYLVSHYLFRHSR